MYTAARGAVISVYYGSENPVTVVATGSSRALGVARYGSKSSTFVVQTVVAKGITMKNATVILSSKLFEVCLWYLNLHNGLT